MSAYENQVVELSLGYQPDDPAGVFDTNITAYVDGPIQIIRGRPGEFDSMQPGTATLVLNNADHRFTPGNVGSPYYPNFKQSRKLRIREVVGNRLFDVFTGYLQLPEIDDWAESGDQVITVSAVDRLGRLSRARAFISTLGEWILANGGSALKAYYPLNEIQPPFADRQGLMGPLSPVISEANSLRDTATTAPAYSAGQGTGPPGDDMRGLLLTPATVEQSGLTYIARPYELYRNLSLDDTSTRPSFATGQTLTAVLWLTLDESIEDYHFPLQFNITDGAFQTTQFFVQRIIDLSTVPNFGRLQASALGSVTDGVVGNYFPGGIPTPIAIQIGYPNTLELWVGSQRYTTTLTGTFNSPQRMSGQLVVGQLGGSISHLQFYAGTYTNAQFLAQMATGWSGLAGQTTGQRIAAVASYAGIPTGELDVDDGVTLMQRATLAGKKPTDAFDAAVATEQGLLFCRGNGRIAFLDRQRTYLR